MDIREELLRIIDALNKAEIEYALCGGLAVVVHGYMRLTDDIDLLVRAQDVAAAKAAVRGGGFSLSTPKPLVFNRGTANEAIVHRVSKFEGEEHLILDLLEVTPALKRVWEERQHLHWEGRRLCVVSAAGLIRMKSGTGRKQDEADIERLGSMEE